MKLATCVLGFQLTTGFFADAEGMTSNRTWFGYAAPATIGSMASGRFGIRNAMERTVYMRREWRDRLPREVCVVELLFGEAAGECKGLIHRHHVDPEDPDSRSVEVCNSHHQRLHAALRALRGPEKAWKRCSHRHTTPEGRAACERRLNQQLTDAA